MDWQSKEQRRQIWLIVALVGGYIFCQALADVAATKFVEVWGIVLPAGSIIFAATFTLRDMLHKRLGKEWARAAIIVAGLLNLVMALYLYWMAKLPAPVWFPYADAWTNIFAIVPSIVLGSIFAEVVSEWVDTEIYHRIMKKFVGKWQFMRVVISNLVSLPLDSFLFGTAAFVLLPPLFGAEAMPFLGAMQAVAGQIIFKAIVTAVSMPGIYLVRERTYA
jgi:uncharacterized integral membrane protein (TIGR00697 family)